MLDYADVIAINKFDKTGALDALHDVRKQYKRNHGLWTGKEHDMPVVGTIASQFNDVGVNELFALILEKIREKKEKLFSGLSLIMAMSRPLTAPRSSRRRGCVIWRRSRKILPNEKGGSGSNAPSPADCIRSMVP
jgi:putative protein kinase ArgK-like GTPase of G3E family